MTEDLWVRHRAVLLVALVTASTLGSGCLQRQDEFPVRWGIGLPEEGSLKEERTKPTADDASRVQQLLLGLAGRNGCRSDDWSSLVELNRPIDGAWIILDGGCLNDLPLDVERLLQDDQPAEAVRLILDSLPESYESLSRALANFTGSESRMLTDLAAHVGYQGMTVRLIREAEAAFAKFENDSRPESLQSAADRALRAELQLRNANYFFEQWAGQEEPCAAEFGPALETLDKHHAALRTLAVPEARPGWPEPPSTENFFRRAILVEDRGLAILADLLQTRIQYHIAYLRSYDATAYPTAGEARFMINQVLQEADRPGILEIVNLRVGATLDAPEYWKRNPRAAMAALAMSEVDWSDTIVYCPG